MNAAGYDFAIPGNHEFDYGMEQFLKLASRMKCGYYCANLIDIKTRKLVLPPYKILALGNKKVAFIGATTPQTLTSSTPKREIYLWLFGGRKRPETVQSIAGSC